MGMIGALKQVWPNTGERIMEDPAFLVDLLFAEDSEYFDLDQSWDGLHFLLSQVGEEHDPSLVETVLGGSQLPQDPNFIVGFVKSPLQVAEIAQSLTKLSEEFLYRYFQVDTMNELSLYPHTDWQEEDFHYLYSYFIGLSNYYQQAAQQKKAMVFCIW